MGRDPGEHPALTAGSAGRRPRDQTRIGLGRGGESLAVTWLEAWGLRVVSRNCRCRYGEAAAMVRSTSSGRSVRRSSSSR
jgi:hypothetical protein